MGYLPNCKFNHENMTKNRMLLPLKIIILLIVIPNSLSTNILKYLCFQVLLVEMASGDSNKPMDYNSDVGGMIIVKSIMINLN